MLYFWEAVKPIWTASDMPTGSTQATTKVAQSKQASKVFLARKLAAELIQTGFHLKLWTVIELVAEPGLTTLNF